MTLVYTCKDPLWQPSLMLFARRLPTELDAWRRVCSVWAPQLFRFAAWRFSFFTCRKRLFPFTRRTSSQVPSELATCGRATYSTVSTYWSTFPRPWPPCCVPAWYMDDRVCMCDWRHPRDAPAVVRRHNHSSDVMTSSLTNAPSSKSTIKQPGETLSLTRPSIRAGSPGPLLPVLFDQNGRQGSSS
jgi:hypothetical protein